MKIGGNEWHDKETLGVDPVRTSEYIGTMYNAGWNEAAIHVGGCGKLCTRDAWSETGWLAFGGIFQVWGAKSIGCKDSRASCPLLGGNRKNNVFTYTLNLPHLIPHTPPALLLSSSPVERSIVPPLLGFTHARGERTPQLRTAPHHIPLHQTHEKR